MKLTLAEPKYLKDSIAIISELVTEARFKLTKDAIELVAMDPANVAMVVFKLLRSCFVDYEIEKEEELALNLDNMKTILKRAKANDIVTIEISDENKLSITFKGSNKRTFSIPIIELEEREQKVPDLSFPISITTSSSILSDAIDDVSIVADAVSFIAEQSKLEITAEGDMSKAAVEIKKDEETAIIADTQDKIKAKYSIEYLKKMVAGSKLADKVTIKFNNDYPLRLDYTAIDKLSLSFILAPRVDQD